MPAAADTPGSFRFPLALILGLITISSTLVVVIGGGAWYLSSRDGRVEQVAQTVVYESARLDDTRRDIQQHRDANDVDRRKLNDLVGKVDGNLNDITAQLAALQAKVAFLIAASQERRP